MLLHVRFSLIILLASCAAPLQTLELENRTPRPIDAVYVYAPGGARGQPRAKLAPNEHTSVRVPQGRVEVYAVSAKYQLDEHTRDVPEASQELEIHGPAKVIFYDQEDKPAEVSRPDVFGVEFAPPHTEKHVPLDETPQ